MPTAIITGASRGIGKVTAEVFAENGYNVVICYNGSRGEAFRLENELKNSGFSACSFKVDVRNSEEIRELFEYTYKKYGEIDVLVNNAGVSQIKLLTDITDVEIDDICSVNFCGTVRLSRDVIPYMLKKHRGSIINVSSVWGVYGASCESVYSGTKGAVISFTKALAKELGPSGIRVNCVAPGVIDTDMNKDLTDECKNELIENTPLMELGTAKNVAEAIFFLGSERASFITGQVLGVDGGFC